MSGNTKLCLEMFPSELSLAPKKTQKNVLIKTDKWHSWQEFIAFCIGKHSTLLITAHFQRLNFVQDFFIYILLGIPVCYIQLILGQYTNYGIVLVRRMVPIAQGITYVYLLTIFVLTVIIATNLETNVIYLVLAFSPSKAVWNICPEEYKNICWDFSKNCTVMDPCLTKSVHLPTYIFWNYSYVGGALPIHKATFGVPRFRGVLIPLGCWLIIYCLAIFQFRYLKRIIRILVTISIICKAVFYVQFSVALSFSKLLANVLVIDDSTWLDPQAWFNSISRVISSMMLGDFTFIMFGVYSNYKAQTGMLAFMGGISGFAILLLEISLIKGAVLTLIEFSKIDLSDVKMFFESHAPSDVILVPAALGILEKSKLWMVLYFFTNIITNLAWCVINITFMQQTMFQRFAALKSYYKYVCLSICGIGFIVGIFLQTKEIYEIRYDLTLTIDSFCQHVNLILLTLIIVYIYGFKRLGDDIQFMSGKQPAYFWKICWIISPVIMMVSTPTEYFDTSELLYKFRVITILIVFSPVILFAAFVTMKRIYDRNIFGLFKSAPLWGPKDDKLRKERLEFHPRKQSKYKKYNEKCPHSCLLHDSVFEGVVRSETYYDQNVIEVLPKTEKK